MLGSYWFLRYKVNKRLVAEIELTNLMATSSFVLMLVPIVNKMLKGK
jgi:hypothetical protein